MRNRMRVLACLIAMSLAGVAFAQSRFDAPLATLRLEHVDGGTRVWGENALEGPVDVQLDAVNAELAGEPDLPMHALLPAHGRIVLAVVAGTRNADDFALRAVPGDPRATPRDVDYRLPVAATLRIDQGFGGAFSHDDDENRYALDLAAPVGTNVLAARDGVVMELRTGSIAHGIDAERFADRANLIRVLHEDGSIALYAHLDARDIGITPGQRVRAGDVIARVGESGFTTGPHLHFAVQVNRGARLVSIPMRLVGPQGPLNLQGD